MRKPLPELHQLVAVPLAGGGWRVGREEWVRDRHEDWDLVLSVDYEDEVYATREACEAEISRRGERLRAALEAEREDDDH